MHGQTRKLGTLTLREKSGNQEISNNGLDMDETIPEYTRHAISLK